MSSDVPEYYRSLAASDDDDTDDDSDSQPTESDSSEASEVQSGPRCYRADAFELTLPNATWQGQSVYTFSGPSVDDMTHRMSVSVTEAVDASDVADFAANEIETVTDQLDDCRVLLDNPLELTCGRPAYRAIFVQYPDDGERRYQEQIYLLYDGDGYTLTAVFTPESRKQIGEDVENMMLSFRPAAHDAAP